MAGIRQDRRGGVEIGGQEVRTAGWRGFDGGARWSQNQQVEMKKHSFLSHLESFN